MDGKELNARIRALVRLKKAHELIGSEGGAEITPGATMQTNYDMFTDVLNSVDVYAFRELTWDLNASVDKIYAEWAAGIYSPQAAPQMARAMQLSEDAANLTWSPIIELRSASTYDLLGNLLSVTDALGRVAFTYTYDLAKHTLATQSIDAGDRFSTPDAANNIIEQRDARNALVLRVYDSLNRPVRLWARDGGGEAITLREKTTYGDDNAGSGLTSSQAAAHNLIGKPYQQYDEAGLLTLSSYDFKGNVLDKARNVIS